MKIEKIRTKKYKLLKLNIIKSKILKKDHYFSGLTVEDVEIRVKKALYIIYRYHIAKKRILFVGNPLNISVKLIKLLRKTKHVVIPTSAWLAGIITNRLSSYKSLFKKEKGGNKISNRLIDLKKKIDLIIVVDEKLNKIIVDESYNSKIPTITFNSDLKPSENKVDYKVPGNFLKIKNDINNSLLYSILIAVLKKADAVKRKFKKYFTTLNTIEIIKRGKRKYYQRKYYQRKLPPKKTPSEKKVFYNAYTKKK